MPSQIASTIGNNLPVDTNAIQNKVLGMLDSIQNGAVVIGQETVKYAPDIVNATLNVIRINQAQELVFGICGLIAVISLHKKIADCFRRIKEEGRPELFIIGYGLSCVYVVGLVNMARLINVWNWMGIFQPKLYLAHELIEKVMK